MERDLTAVVKLLAEHQPVHAAAEFAQLSPPPLPVVPEWSPVARFGGYAKPMIAGCDCAAF